MINYDYIIKENIEENNPNWSQMLDHAYRISIIGGSRFRKTNALFNLIKQQNDDEYKINEKIVR